MKRNTRGRDFESPLAEQLREAVDSGELDMQRCRDQRHVITYKRKKLVRENAELIHTMQDAVKRGLI